MHAGAGADSDAAPDDHDTRDGAPRRDADGRVLELQRHDLRRAEALTSRSANGLIRQIRCTTWDSATWPVMKEAPKDALRLQAQMRRRAWWE